MKRYNKSHKHIYPHYKVNMTDVLNTFDNAYHSWLIADGIYKKPIMRECVWFHKYMNIRFMNTYKTIFNFLNPGDFNIMSDY